MDEYVQDKNTTLLAVGLLMLFLTGTSVAKYVFKKKVEDQVAELFSHVGKPDRMITANILAAPLVHISGRDKFEERS